VRRPWQPGPVLGFGTKGRGTVELDIGSYQHSADAASIEPSVRSTPAAPCRYPAGPPAPPRGCQTRRSVLGSVHESGGRGATVSFREAKFSGGEVSFLAANFPGSAVSFGGAKFSGGAVSFGGEFSGSTISFGGAEFSGGTVSFVMAEFSGGEVDFSDAGDWLSPPKFAWIDIPPQGVKLPRKEDQSTV
jgi:hypothetical protein